MRAHRHDRKPTRLITVTVSDKRSAAEIRVTARGAADPHGRRWSGPVAASPPPAAPAGSRHAGEGRIRRGMVPDGAARCDQHQLGKGLLDRDEAVGRGGRVQPGRGICSCRTTSR
jgi:hypothetical protein